MKYEEIRCRVWEANCKLPDYGLVTFTWGNISGIDRNKGIVAIKPSGVAYDQLTPEDIVVCNLEGAVIEGGMVPSSDLMTHLELYQNIEGIGGVVHTHSRWATIYAQAGRGIQAYGTTHADYFYGEIPCTRPMTKQEIDTDYERETGRVIVQCVLQNSSEAVPAVLVHSHGPFAWGRDAHDALHQAVVLEEVAMMAYHSEILGAGKLSPMQQSLLDKHYLRKHGKDAYYGQAVQDR